MSKRNQSGDSLAKRIASAYDPDDFDEEERLEDVFAAPEETLREAFRHVPGLVSDDEAEDSENEEEEEEEEEEEDSDSESSD